MSERPLPLCCVVGERGRERPLLQRSEVSVVAPFKGGVRAPDNRLIERTNRCVQKRGTNFLPRRNHENERLRLKMTETVNAVAPSIIHGIRFCTIFAKRRVFNNLFSKFCSPDFSDHFSHFSDGIKLSPGCARAVWLRAKKPMLR